MAHRRMRHEKLGSLILRDEPMPCNRCAGDHFRLWSLVLFPTLEIDGTRKRRERDELCEGEARLLCQLFSGFEGVFTIGRQAENKRSQDVNSAITKLTELAHQIFAGRIEV